MPKSDTWPGGTGLDMVTGMDSAGSCDSVVSANSGFSDDSLEHLSAEEKACLMFLEETIESLDTEEDSGMSNDEPDPQPSPGNVVNKVADLSTSMSKSPINSAQRDATMDPVKENSDTQVMHSYLVPTPFLLANNSPCSVPAAKTAIPPHKNPCSKPPSSPKAGHEHSVTPGAPQVPLEIKVVTPPPTKSREHSVRPADGSRGPLSYDALVHLRRSASTKKTPLCPTVDHTIDRHPPPIIEETKPNLGNPLTFDRSRSEPSHSKAAPPAVPPKPKKIPANISVQTQSGACINRDNSFIVRRVVAPQIVRQEALMKLGLLKEPENEVLPSPPKPQSSLDKTSKKHVKSQFNVHPSRSPSFCHFQASTEPKTRPLQSSASFHHTSRCDQRFESHPAQSNKTTGLESPSAVDSHRNGGFCPEPQHIITSAKPVRAAPAAEPTPPKPSNSVGYTVMVVPGMGADRKEALRKLGLLKDSNK